MTNIYQRNRTGGSGSLLQALLLTCLLLKLSGSTVFSQYSFTTITSPPFTSATPFGISAGVVAGVYIDGNHGSPGFQQQGFIYDGATFTLLNAPLAHVGATWAYGIENGSVVGYYVANSDGSDHAYVYHNGIYTTLSISSSQAVAATGIAGNNIVGIYQSYQQPNNQVVSNGFLYDGFTYTTLNAPLGINGTYINGINASGQIVGYYQDAIAYHGFSYKNGTWATIDDPLGVNGTKATGVDGNGNIVGYYYDANLTVHGFIYDGSSYSTLDAPNAHSTAIEGISFDGVIVGVYADNINQFQIGFIATVPEPSSLLSIPMGFTAIFLMSRNRKRHRAPVL